MTRVACVVSIGAVLVAAAAGAQAPVADPAGRSPRSENGKRLYEQDGCYQCHGYAAQGGRDGARLAATSMTAPSFIRYVRRPFGAMPAFTAKVLSDQELTDIYTYLKTLPAARPSKDIPLLNQMR
jgi:mono/diheme cytochrome c family protein